MLLKGCFLGRCPRGLVNEGYELMEGLCLLLSVCNKSMAVQPFQWAWEPLK